MAYVVRLVLVTSRDQADLLDLQPLSANRRKVSSLFPLVPKGTSSARAAGLLGLSLPTYTPGAYTHTYYYIITSPSRFSHTFRLG